MKKCPLRKKCQYHHYGDYVDYTEEVFMPCIENQCTAYLMIDDIEYNYTGCYCNYFNVEVERK